MGYTFKHRLSLVESKEAFIYALCSLWKYSGNKGNLDVRIVIVLCVVHDARVVNCVECIVS